MISYTKIAAGVLFLGLTAGLLLHTTAADSAVFDKKTSSALSHYIMAVMYDGLDEPDKAIEEYKKTLKIDRDNTVVHLNLAASLIKKDDIPGAIEELNLASKYDPDAIEPYAILALLYTSQNKRDSAAGAYELALKNASKIQPENIDIYKSLGLLYLQQKKLQDAENTYRLIVQLASGDAEAHFYLANIYNETEKNDSAEKELKRALELNPDYHEALNFLGYLYVEENRNLNEAEIMINRALEMSPGNGAYIDSLGWLYFQQGMFEQAVGKLEEASSLLEDPVIFDHLGDAYLKINEAEKAKLNWKRSLELDPEQDKVKQKIEKLDNSLATNSS